MFSERKIESFEQRVSDLPDTPALSAAALKARFDACPEELRAALNGVCDDGKALEDRINAYRAQTFAGEITENMLDTPLLTKINGKAEQSDMTAMQTSLAHKCELYCGAYTGDGADSQMISLGFTPKAVLAILNGYSLNYSSDTYGGLAVAGFPACSGGNKLIEIIQDGFLAYNSTNRLRANISDSIYHYIAFT